MATLNIKVPSLGFNLSSIERTVPNGKSSKVMRHLVTKYSSYNSVFFQCYFINKSGRMAQRSVNVGL